MEQKAAKKVGTSSMIDGWTMPKTAQNMSLVIELCLIWHATVGSKI